MEKIPFSIVTTCRNEIKSLPRWKQNIQAQTRQPDEIVVVDAFSDDGTYEFLSEWAERDNRIKVIQEKGAAAHGRNLAIENATHDHILTTDLGVRLSKNWCEALIHPFEEDENVEVVAGNTCIDIETLNTTTARAEYYIENEGVPKLEPGFVIGNRSSAYLKRVWEEVRGLPEDLTFYADDSVFGRQIAEMEYKMAFAPKAMTHWGRPDTLQEFWKEQFNYGRGDGEANIKKPFFFKLYQSKSLPWQLAVIGNAFWNLKKQIKLRAFRQAISKNDFSALFIMPVLALGNGWYRMKGYKVGFEWGNGYCTECRERLSGDW